MERFYKSNLYNFFVIFVIEKNRDESLFNGMRQNIFYLPFTHS